MQDNAERSKAKFKQFQRKEEGTGEAGLRLKICVFQGLGTRHLKEFEAVKTRSKQRISRE